MSSFKAYFAKNIRSAHVESFTPATGSDAFVAGDLVYYDTTTNTMKLCGADPALIAGLAEVDSTSSTISPDGKVPIRLLHSDDIIAMSSATDFATSNIGDSLDLEYQAAGKWRVLTSTSAVRLICRGGVPAADSLDGAIWFVQFIAANLQFDAVAS